MNSFVQIYIYIYVCVCVLPFTNREALLCEVAESCAVNQSVLLISKEEH